MRLLRVQARGFRCFGEENALNFELRAGLNILVGENDSGKTSIVDAIRLALGSRSEDWLRISARDFHVPPGMAEPVSTMEIVCTFGMLSPDEQSAFLEWCTLEEGALALYVCFRAELKSTGGDKWRTSWTRKAGRDGDGPTIEGPLREFLAVTYLRPLRDAERELSPGRRSRLSQILASLPAMDAQDAPGQAQQPSLRDVVKRADKEINAHSVIRAIQDDVNRKYLDRLSIGSPLAARLGLGNAPSLAQLLERLELALGAPAGQQSNVGRGLGLNNVLFMATELLLLRQPNVDQFGFLVIEEPEAHLHPQLQARFMRMLQKEVEGDESVQVLVTTHSPLLAAGADLQGVTLVVQAKAYALSVGRTELESDDYAFLGRFLDATKANLFFARGVLVVEGDAENLLLPAIAEKIGKPLDEHGVSIVKVGHAGLFRYARILRRKDPGEQLPVPVAMVADRDMPPAEAVIVGVEQPKTEAALSAADVAKATAKLIAHEGGNVRGFVSPRWTLEFDIAFSGMAAELWRAIEQAKEARKKTAKRTSADIASACAQTVATLKQTKSDVEIACEVFRPLHEKTIGKPEVAQQLAEIIRNHPDPPDTVRQRLPQYLVEAIEFVTSAAQAVPAAGANQP